MESLHPTSPRGVGREAPISSHGSRAVASDTGSDARGRRSRRRRRRALVAPLALAAAVGALAGPAAALPAEQDLRSADASDAGLAATSRATEPGPQNLRSADASDAAALATSGGGAEPAQAPQNLRSADASDAGASVRRSADGRSDQAASSDFHLGDAAIGAGSVIALAGVSLGIALAVQARRRRHTRPPASAVTTS